MAIHIGMGGITATRYLNLLEGKDILKRIGIGKRDLNMCLNECFAAKIMEVCT